VPNSSRHSRCRHRRWFTHLRLGRLQPLLSICCCAKRHPHGRRISRHRVFACPTARSGVPPAHLDGARACGRTWSPKRHPWHRSRPRPTAARIITSRHDPRRTPYDGVVKLNPRAPSRAAQIATPSSSPKTLAGAPQRGAPATRSHRLSRLFGIAGRRSLRTYRMTRHASTSARASLSPRMSWIAAGLIRRSAVAAERYLFAASLQLGADPTSPTSAVSQAAFRSRTSGEVLCKTPIAYDLIVASKCMLKERQLLQNPAPAGHCARRHRRFYFG